MGRLSLPHSAVRDWAIKDLVSRDPLPPDTDELQIAAAVRRQVEAMRTFAGHALRVYCRSIDVPPSEITDADVAAAAVAIAMTASDLRQDLADGHQVLDGVPIATPDQRQLQNDEAVLELLAVQLAPPQA